MKVLVIEGGPHAAHPPRPRSTGHLRPGPTQGSKPIPTRRHPYRRSYFILRQDPKAAALVAECDAYLAKLIDTRELSGQLSDDAERRDAGNLQQR
jgi:hypothetical protein